MESSVIFVENDSTDSTKTALKNWSSKNHARIIELDGLARSVQKRTERIAYARNAYLKAISESDLKNYDYLVVVDMDTPNTIPLDVKSFNLAINFLEERDEVAAVFANQTPIYYDVWALREKSWCSNDCWHEVRTASATTDYQSALKKYIYDKQIFIHPDKNPIEVDSAFGGLGVYKIKNALLSRYNGLDEDGSEVCEHVSFNLGLRAQGMKLYILPFLLNLTSFEHAVLLAKTHGFMPIEAAGSKLNLLAGLDHQLSNYRREFPLYDERFPILAKLYSDHRSGSILDIGANIGDGIALCRLHGCTSKYICVEGHDPFFMLLCANTFINKSFFEPYRLFDKFASLGENRVSVSSHQGTASLSADAAQEAINHDKFLNLQDFDDNDVGLIKIDTDGNDAKILMKSINYIEVKCPIVWAEAEVFSSNSLTEWNNLLSLFCTLYKYVVIFDNFGFAVAAGKLNELKDFINYFFQYIHNQRASDAEKFGKPKIYYLDIAFFHDKDQDLFNLFLSELKELQSSRPGPI